MESVVHRWASAWVVSVFAHGILVLVGAVWLARTLDAQEAADLGAARIPGSTVKQDEIDLWVTADGSKSPDAVRLPYAPTLAARGGGEALPRPDTGRAGRGGTDTAEARAMNLADRDDGTYLTRDLENRVDRDQIPRIKSATSRASWEDWRASREPMELTFLASGHSDSERPERRKDVGFDPSQGGRSFGPPERVGAALGAAVPPPGEGEAPRLPGDPDPGADRSSPGAGVFDGQPGFTFQDAAKIALARPRVDAGDPSVPSTEVGNAKDTADSEQESTSRSPSIVHASSAGGAPGAGPGGQSGPGATGSGGTSGAGSQSKTLGTGVGPGLDNSQTDPRRMAYIRDVQAKIGAAYRAAPNPFPTRAIVEGLQGLATIRFTVRADGTVSSASVSRPSGIPEFDEACRRIVSGVTGLPALPASLGSTFSWSMTFEARNPAVLPKNLH